jgi:hypothetical protein
MKKRLLTALAVLTGLFLLSTSIVWAQVAPVEKTGQTTSYRTGDDGDLQKGVGLCEFVPRFTDNGDGTVTDNLTGLMWVQDANAARIWNSAIDDSYNLSFGNAGCGSTYTDWRLPNIKELQSLIDYGNSSGPTLPSGHPFTYLHNSYWSSTSLCDPNTDFAYVVNINDGSTSFSEKTSSLHVWPVRDAN